MLIWRNKLVDGSCCNPKSLICWYLFNSLTRLTLTFMIVVIYLVYDLFWNIFYYAHFHLILSYYLYLFLRTWVQYRLIIFEWNVIFLNQIIAKRNLFDCFLRIIGNFSYLFKFFRAFHHYVWILLRSCIYYNRFSAVLRAIDLKLVIIMVNNIGMED